MLNYFLSYFRVCRDKDSKYAVVLKIHVLQVLIETFLIEWASFCVNCFSKVKI